MNRIFLVRNGQTISNIKGVVLGQSSGKLSKKGKEQAKLVGKFIKDLNIVFAKVYCSPLERAKETYFYIRLPNKPIFDDRLKERKFGILQGKAYEQIINLPSEVKPKEGESLLQTQIRATSFLQEAVESLNKKDNILIISHHELILSIICKVINLPLLEARRIAVSNCGLTEILWIGNKWRALRINEIGYLNSSYNSHFLD